MKPLILTLILLPAVANAGQGLCPDQVRKDYKDTFLQCLDKTHINALSGDKYQGWDEVVKECHDAAEQIAGVERNGYLICYITLPKD